MSNSVQSLQAANVHAQREQTVQPPKQAQTAAQNPVPADTVTISPSAQQALAAKANPASRDVDYDGDSH
ncbi:MAG: hypothetical protein LAN18_04775 [Acidobacteriia bacterium]|nr:hypothetical protein [Terriglobia bacterium]